MNIYTNVYTYSIIDRELSVGSGVVVRGELFTGGLAQLGSRLGGEKGVFVGLTNRSGLEWKTVGKRKLTGFVVEVDGFLDSFLKFFNNNN